jgi:2,3-dihydroxybiphenyl 1,2-dioxygenase
VDFVGMQAVPAELGTAYRIDDRSQRLFVEPGEEDRIYCFGWEAKDAEALEQIVSRLEAAGIEVVAEPASLAARRHVSRLVSLNDPAGNRLELFHGAQVVRDHFQAGRGISGFRTGACGMGHVALTVRDLNAMIAFYGDLLGFRPTDFIRDPFDAYFLHLNARHHSIGLINTGTDGLHHLMLEYLSLDDVGHAYDLVLDRGQELATTLGRHTNDLMTSFYVATPAGFLIELGWGGREIEIEGWLPHEITNGASIWGHDRRWLPEAARARARNMRIEAAKTGLFEPVQVIDGNFVRKKRRGPSTLGRLSEK